MLCVCVLAVEGWDGGTLHVLLGRVSSEEQLSCYVFSMYGDCSDVLEEVGWCARFLWVLGIGGIGRGDG